MTAVAVRDEKAAKLSSYIARLQPELARALPKHLDADRLARLALTVVRQSMMQSAPDQSLAECTPESFAGALLTAAALGLEPGVNAEAYLVPYKGECTLIIGYQGYAKLFWQHPMAKHLDAHAVHEHDDFDYAYGLAQYLRHKPARGDRGKVTHYYAVAELASGASAFVVLSADEVKALRGGKVGPSGKIPDPQHWMERKTVLRQLIKLLPKSTTLQSALAVDEQRGTVLAETQTATSIAQGDAVVALEPVRYEQEPQERVTVADIARQQQREPSGLDEFHPDTSHNPTGPAPSITRQQQAALMASFNEAGITDRTDRLLFCTDATARTIDTTNALTRDEAKVCIDLVKNPGYVEKWREGSHGDGTLPVGE
jgi:recombination protein RecT